MTVTWYMHLNPCCLRSSLCDIATICTPAARSATCSSFGCSGNSSSSLLPSPTSTSMTLTFCLVSYATMRQRRHQSVRIILGARADEHLSCARRGGGGGNMVASYSASASAASPLKGDDGGAIFSRCFAVRLRLSNLALTL